MVLRSGRLILLVLLVGWGGEIEGSQAQTPGTASHGEGTRFCQQDHEGQNLDVRGLAVVYCTTAPAVRGPLEAMHSTARPVFFGAVPAAWLRAGLLRSTGAASEAYRLTVSQGVTYGVVVGVKRAVGRPRPYVTRALEAREERYGPMNEGEMRVSFPSGHAGISAALVTSWSLSHPYWYVIGPGAVWATGVGISRLYLGVHYPSDVLTGAVVGTGVALLVHHLRSVLTPSSLKATVENGGTVAPPVTLRVRF